MSWLMLLLSFLEELYFCLQLNVLLSVFKTNPPHVVTGRGWEALGEEALALYWRN